MKLLSTIIAALLLFGCATSPKDLAKQSKIEQTRPTCNGAADCNAKWEAAQLWVVHNAGLKIQINTNIVIETYNSTDMSLAVRVTKEPLGGGRYKLVASVWCQNYIGCDSDPLDAIINFNSTIGNAPVIISGVTAPANSQQDREAFAAAMQASSAVKSPEMKGSFTVEGTRLTVHSPLASKDGWDKQIAYSGWGQFLSLLAQQGFTEYSYTNDKDVMFTAPVK